MFSRFKERFLVGDTTTLCLLTDAGLFVQGESEVFRYRFFTRELFDLLWFRAT